jgi:hypothetical protein
VYWFFFVESFVYIEGGQINLVALWTEQGWAKALGQANRFGLAPKPVFSIRPLLFGLTSETSITY